MTKTDEKQIALMVKNLAAYGEQLLELQQKEENELDIASANAKYAEQLEENAALLDEAAFFLEEARKNLLSIPNIADLIEE